MHTENTYDMNRWYGAVFFHFIFESGKYDPRVNF